MSDYWLYRQLQSVDLVASVASSDIAEVHHLVNRQQTAIRDLTVAVAVLSKMLIDAGVIDEKVMSARIEVGIEEMIEAAKIVDCIACLARVPLGRTQVTAAGNVCDTCTK